MTVERLRELDRALFNSVTGDLCDFTLDDGFIVRVGEWGYIKAVDYERLFENERERFEYQAINNADYGDYVLETIESVSAMSDDELFEFLDELNDEVDCSIYYTEAE